MELNAQIRTLLGKKTKGLRKSGFIPAEVFGRGIQNKHLSVQAKEFAKVYKKAGENTIISLIIDSSEKMPAIISETQVDPISRAFISVDFRAVRKDEKINVDIPIEYKGTDMAAKNGYVLVKTIVSIEIETLPQHIPHSFVVDITSLQNPGQSIEIKDIEIPDNVKITIPENTVIATVTEKEKEEAAKVEIPLTEENAEAEVIKTEEGGIAIKEKPKA
ncbi:hypothetical protein A3I34_03025 [Candidatus Jorgensenbacteria bacterium RIFCSPLOWO2_02_FULL_45_12]|uniref:Large ribosomal subunit protein bL25 n=1 Tax=Candidatus Jorgensenbacteria bacterium RIFCSPHIGHO2_02_FULL_45_20 TaxID=1798470 RepID=A0A1F6BNB2_9BACT|nr:MAG: hypothetical protein A3D55_00865 [Candidatus Jorgensenbacteria bacterium RIFCSPHIGHO2_02_FULL_45_20]OGG42411.1 MAG: hypothetical protein A3I34_03025 [Candidatus Jorgensenbacteria bacterium RIFCSPLOWO2_02_FULL_45_12]